MRLPWSALGGGLSPSGGARGISYGLREVAKDRIGRVTESYLEFVSGNDPERPNETWQRLTASEETSTAAGERMLAGEERKTRLLGNAPNPFAEQTTLSYTLERPSQVRLAVFDLLGRKVRTLVEGQKREGTHDVRFEVDGLPAGVYVYRLETSWEVQTRKMTVVR